MAVRVIAPMPSTEDSHFELALSLLCAQGLSSSSAVATARALALLLERSGHGLVPRPVVLSASEAAHKCGFDRRTWWTVKRRLLALGHLVGSAGGQTPRGSLGGRGRKGVYCVSPETFSRFHEDWNAWVYGPRDLAETGKETGMERPRERDVPREETVMQGGKKVMVPGEKVMPRGETVMPLPSSEERPLPRSTSLLSNQTSDVLRVLEGRTSEENPSAEAPPGEDAPRRDPPPSASHHRFEADPVETARAHHPFPSRKPRAVAPSAESRTGRRTRARLRGDERPTLDGDRERWTHDLLTWLGKRVLESRARERTDRVGARESVEGLAVESLASGEVVRLFEEEPRSRVRVALVQLLERVLVFERVDRCQDPRERRALLRTLRPERRLRGRAKLSGPGPEPVRSSDRASPAPERPLAPAAAPSHDGGDDAAKTVNGAVADGVPPPVASRPPAPELPRGASAKPPDRPERRRSRAAHPLWSPDDETEKRETFAHVGAILELANREFGASFDVERSRRDTLLYPYEVVRGAVANVLLKKARGYKFENPGAVLWDAITLPGYRLEEFAVANLEEVLKRCAGAWAPAPEAPVVVPPNPAPPAAGAGEAERERRRAEARRQLYESLPPEVRDGLDQRARESARADFPARGTVLDEAVFGLRVLRARDDLLEREHGAALAEKEALVADVSR